MDGSSFWRCLRAMLACRRWSTRRSLVYCCSFLATRQAGGRTPHPKKLSFPASERREWISTLVHLALGDFLRMGLSSSELNEDKNSRMCKKIFKLCFWDIVSPLNLMLPFVIWVPT